MMDVSTEDSTTDSVLVLRDSPVCFLWPGMSPSRVVDFGIDLVSGTVSYGFGRSYSSGRSSFRLP